VCILNKNEFGTVKLICEQEYPSIPTKLHDVDGGALFIEQREEVIAGLEESINLFMDIVDFLQKSKALLLSIPYIITSWSLETNRNISMLYFDLLGNYIKVLKLFAVVEDRKALVAVYVTAIRVGDAYVREGDKLIPNAVKQVADEQRQKEANFLSVFTRNKKSEKLTKSSKEVRINDDAAEAVEEVIPMDGREYWSYSTRILQLMTISENLPSHFIHNFAPISSLNRMKPMLLQFLPSLLFVDNVERLRAWGTLNTLNSINEMGNPSIMQKMPLAESTDDTFSSDKVTKLSAHYEILYSDKYCEYIVYGFLVCPHLMCDKETYALYRLVCSRRLFIRLFRELNINIHLEFSHYETEYLSATEKMPTKLDNYVDIPRKINVAKAVKDVAKNATKKCGHLQRHRRSYIHSELRVMLGIITTMPTLLGPLASQLIAIAGFAKMELLDFLRHSATIESDIRKDCQKYYDENQYKCNDLVSLLYDLQCAIDLVIKYSTSVIKPYYVEFLIKNDLVDLTRFKAKPGVSELPRPVRAYLDNFISELTLITEDQEILDSETMKLEQMRLNLDRVVGLITSANGYEHELITSFTDIMFSLSERSYYIDSIDLLVQEFCEPHEVWWYNSQLIELYKNSLADATSDTSAHYTSVFTVIRASLSNIHPDCPSEELLLGKTALGICDKLLQKLGVHVLLQFKQLWLIFQGLDNQLQPVEAAKRLTRMILSKMKQQEDEGVRASDIQLTAELLPGSESEYWASGSIANIITMINNLSRTLAAVSNYGTFTVYNREYSPHIFIKDLLVTFLDSQLELFFINDSKRTVAGGVVLNRPSSCIRQFLNGLNTALFITSFMNVDILNDLRNLLFDAMIETKLVPPGTPITLTAIPMPHMRNTLIWQIASYFCDMIPVLASNLGGTLWIPSKKAFTTIVTQDTILGELDTGGVDANISTTPFDMVINSNDLVILMSFLGTQGMKVIEARIIEYISVELLIIFSTIELNEEVLRTITFHHNDANFDTSIIKLIGMDKLQAALINIGVALALRDTLRNSLGTSLSKMAPSLHAIVKAALDGINPLENMRFASNVSALAHDAGVQQSHDFSLFHALRSTIDDEVQQKGIDLDLFAAAAACIFSSDKWARTTYLPQYEAFMANEHCSMLAISSLLFCCGAYNCEAGTVDGIPVNVEESLTHMSELFLQMSSQILLLLYQKEVTAKVVKRTNIPIRAMFILLEQFVAINPFVHTGTLEKFIPYGFLHTNVMDVYMGSQRISDPRKLYNYSNTSDMNRYTITE
jgi:hypothetical protein